MVDVNLIPSILPNIFIISKSLSPTQFASLVLPGLKPLFALKDPPQNMLTLLDNLPLLQEKADKGVFKEREVSIWCCGALVYMISSDVLPLVYNALESEHAVVCYFVVVTSQQLTGPA